MTERMTRWCGVAVFLALLPHSLAQLSQAQVPSRNSGRQGKTLLRDGWPPPFKTWLEQDVAWIITPEEKGAFKLLRDDEQRDDFVEAFWQRRDPTPDNYENEFKEEHYRRIVYANGHFGESDPGWKSDRGRIYIIYGPPDSVRTYSAKDRPSGTRRTEHSGLQSESWSYRFLEGVGMDVVVDFIDICSCGDYRMKMPEELRDDLLIPSGLMGERPRTDERGKPEIYFKPIAPKSRFPELEQLLNSKSVLRNVPVEVSTDVVKATDISSIVRVAISFKKAETATQDKEGSSGQTLNVLGRFRSLTGRIVEQFEDVITLDPSGRSEARLEKSIPVLNAHYQLEIAAVVSHTRKASTWIGILDIKP